MEKCDPYLRDEKVVIVSEMTQICKLANKEFYCCFPNIADCFPNIADKDFKVAITTV